MVSPAFETCLGIGREGGANADLATETELKNAAWYYPTPFDKAKNIKDYVAFCECFPSRSRRIDHDV